MNTTTKTKMGLGLAMIAMLMLSSFARAADFEVPSRLAAPVILYDEGGNILADADYHLSIALRAADGNILYTEEQDVNVRDGIASINLGEGFVPGSGFAVPSGGLSEDIFLAAAGDIAVEILVEGQVTPQEVAVLGSQPYAFVAQMALTLADDTVNSAKIVDGSVTWEDLAESLKARFEENSETVTAELVSTAPVSARDVGVDSDIGLNNASGSNVHEVMQQLDAAIDSLREVRLDTLDASLDTVESDLGTTQLDVTGLQGDLGTAQSDISALQGSLTQTQSDLSTTESSLNASIATLNTSLTGTQVNVSEAQADIETLESSMGTAQSNISALQGDVIAQQGSLSDLQGDLGAVQNSVTMVQSEVNTAESAISQLQTGLSSTQSTVSGLSSSVSTLQSGLSSTQSSVSSLQSGLSSAEGNIVSLQNSLSSTQTNVSGLSSSVSTLQSGLSSTQSSVSSLQSGLSSAQGNIASLQNSLSSTQTNVSGLSSSVSALQSGLSSTQSDVSTNYLRLNGDSVMGDSLDLGGNDIVNIDLIDGVDVATLDNRVSVLENEATPDNVTELGYVLVQSGASSFCPVATLQNPAVQSVNLENMGNFIPGSPGINAQLDSHYIAVFRLYDTFDSTTTANFTMNHRFGFSYTSGGSLYSTLVIETTYSGSGDCSDMHIEYAVYRQNTPAI